MPPIWHILWQMIRYAQRLYWVDTLLWLLILGLPIVPGVLIREFFNTLTQQPASDASPWVWIGLLLVVGLARVVAIFTGRITKTQHRFLISGLVRHNLMLGLLKRPGAELATGGIKGQKTSPGEILSYFRDDAFQIEDTVVGTNEIFASGVFAVGSVVLLLSVNATLTLLVFLPLCAIATLAHKAEHRLKRYRRASRQATQAVTGLIGEIFTAIQAIKVAGAEASVLEELTKRCDRRRQLMVRDRVFTAVLESGFANIVSLGTGLLLLLASQSLGTQSNLSVGDFALFVYYLSFVTYFLEFLGSFLATIKQSEVSFERMAGLLVEKRVDEVKGEEGVNGLERDPVDERAAKAAPTPVRLSGSAEASAVSSAEPLTVETSRRSPLIHPSTPPLPHSPHPITHPHLLYLKPIVGSQPPLPRPTPIANRDPLQTLQVKGLTYRYPNSDRGIINISFTLQHGSLTVITGRVGAGKTTLLRVLLGLLPRQAGCLFWNDQKIQDPATFLIPPQAAYTPQVPQLFSTSLRENLLLGLETDVTQGRAASTVVKGRLQSAIATAAFDQDLAALPNGFETSIGTRGVRLSGGQKQRLATARMLLRQSELMVFDDLSSALDVETERQLWKNLLPENSSTIHAAAPPPPDASTYLAVSHRPSVIQRADQLIVLEAGQVIFSGLPHDFDAGNLIKR